MPACEGHCGDLVSGCTQALGEDSTFYVLFPHHLSLHQRVPSSIYTASANVKKLPEMGMF